MTDEKKLPEGLEDVDWDQALAEWEDKAFAPEPARDVQTDKPASLAGSQPPSKKPLYRPPGAQPAPPAPAAVRPVEPRRTPTPAAPHEDDEEDNATVISSVPRELLREEPAPRSHAGLGQLFAREGRPETSIDVSFDESQPRVPAASPAPPVAPATVEPPREEPPSPAQQTEAGPALHAPDARKYDPNDETMIGDGGPGAARTWADEKPASAWLSDAARQHLAAQAKWLEREARALEDETARARGLLACSEIVATLGDRDRAQALATDARDLAPSLVLAHVQARSLMHSPDPEDYVAALDAEAKASPAAGRVHSALLAAEVLRAVGSDEEADRRLERAGQAATNDVRAPVLRAARALSGGDATSPALRPDRAVPELAPLAEALPAVLRLRGVERPDAAAERSPNETLMALRAAIDKGDAAGAAPIAARLAAVPELAAGAKWLAASLGATRHARRADAVRWLRELADGGDERARRALVARAIELDDRDAITESLAGGGFGSPAESLTVAILGGLELTATDPRLDATASEPGLQPLAAAAAAIASPPGDDHAAHAARARQAAGTPPSRAATRLGRLLAAAVPARDVDEVLSELGDDVALEGARALRLEMAARSDRAIDVSAALQAWGAGRSSAEDRAQSALAAALVAEQAGETARALEAYRAAREADPSCEAALRAIASLEQVDLVSELCTLADARGEGPAPAIARLEAAVRGEAVLPEPTRADLLDRTHRAAPALPMASYLAERIARRAGDVEQVLHWVRERRATTADPIEAALESVREALLVADGDAALASERLLDAHRARPADVALRELYERISPEPPEGGAAWREQRAAEASDGARTLLFLEAAHEYERAGDEQGALRCAEAAATTDSSLGRVARERAELRAGSVARLAEELFSVAKTAEDGVARREAFERLAVLDATARQDPASALLWHRSILEAEPGHLPSLRHVEHQFVGEGRDEELEPIAGAIATALRGTGPGECTAHAELAARLRLRGAEGSWEATREMVGIAAGEGEPSLWALRMTEAHARARGDDEALLAATLRLVDRAARPAETAALLLRAAEAASRVGRADEARAHLERAAIEDPGDVVVWGLLADARRVAGDARGAAEAHESLARSSMVREHQLRAWYDAGRTWQDEVNDEDRALVALEAAAVVDPAFEDVFDRLSRLYVARKMQPELAGLLERRLDRITDPEERLVMEVRRGRVLLEAGDAQGARAAFEAALGQRPDDPGALSAFADLCASEQDWPAAEQALVRLARLLPTPEQQRDVYSRLGDLYAKHLVNLSRAEVALKEVLKRTPDDADGVETRERLVDVYKRQNDSARAVEVQQELVAKAASAEEKRRRIVELALIHEQTAHDARKAEQTLEAARREAPLDAAVLRAMVEFYERHRQTPAVHVLLDRAAGDARRALAAGRFSNAPFEVLATAFELRGKKDAAGIAHAMLAALEGRDADLRGARGAGGRAFEPRLDDLLAPELLGPAMRALLAKTGDALDAASPVDARALQATPLPEDAPLARFAAALARDVGLPGVQILVTPRAGASCVPGGSSPPLLLVGSGLTTEDPLSRFHVVRALKLVAAHASALARAQPSELAVLVGAWLKCFNSSWQPQGVPAAALNALSAVGGRVQAAMPKRIDPDLGVMALEVGASLGTQTPALGAAALQWGNRVALLALGDPSAAIDAIASAAGLREGAPEEPEERTKWIAASPEARDLLAFGATDAFAQARAMLGMAT